MKRVGMVVLGGVPWPTVTQTTILYLLSGHCKVIFNMSSSDLYSMGLEIKEKTPKGKARSEVFLRDLPLAHLAKSFRSTKPHTCCKAPLRGMGQELPRCTGCYSHYCAQLPNKREPKVGRVYLGP